MEKYRFNTKNTKSMEWIGRSLWLRALWTVWAKTNCLSDVADSKELIMNWAKRTAWHKLLKIKGHSPRNRNRRTQIRCGLQLAPQSPEFSPRLEFSRGLMPLDLKATPEYRQIRSGQTGPELRLRPRVRLRQQSARFSVLNELTGGVLICSAGLQAGMFEVLPPGSISLLVCVPA